MRRPMIPLTAGVAISNKHTRLTCLETNTLLAALSTAVDRHIVHPTGQLFLIQKTSRSGLRRAGGWTVLLSWFVGFVVL